MTSPVAIVTGGAQGIGRATALALAATGAEVHIVDIADDAGAATVALIEDDGGTATFHHQDLFVDGGPATAVERVTGVTDGRIDMLVNNAFSYRRKPDLAAVPSDEFGADLQRLVVSYHAMVAAARPHLQANGGGAVVNLASVRGRYSGPGFGAYSVAKAAVAQMTRVLALELGADGIRVNAVAPGVIGTAPTMALDPRRRDLMGHVTPIGRIGTPADVASVIAFLLSDGAAYVTGQIIRIDGGLSLPLQIDTMQQGIEYGLASDDGFDGLTRA